MKLYNAKGELQISLTKAQILTLLGVLEAEMNQLKTLDDTTISAAQWGYLGALTTDPIGGDGTAGRVIRGSHLVIDNGTNAATLKCTLSSRWNGDAIAQTDNIAKGATTGHFTLNADGTTLRIEAAGLTGNALYAFFNLSHNASGTAVNCYGFISSNDITFYLRDAAAGTNLDMTTLVDTGNFYVDILYITDA